MKKRKLTGIANCEVGQERRLALDARSLPESGRPKLGTDLVLFGAVNRRTVKIDGTLLDRKQQHLLSHQLNEVLASDDASTGMDAVCPGQCTALAILLAFANNSRLQWIDT